MSCRYKYASLFCSPVILSIFAFLPAYDQAPTKEAIQACKIASDFYKDLILFVSFSFLPRPQYFSRALCQTLPAIYSLSINVPTNDLGAGA